MARRPDGQSGIARPPSFHSGNRARAPPRQGIARDSIGGRGRSGAKVARLAGRGAVGSRAGQYSRGLHGPYGVISMTALSRSLTAGVPRLVQQGTSTAGCARRTLWCGALSVLGPSSAAPATGVPFSLWPMPYHTWYRYAALAWEESPWWTVTSVGRMTSTRPPPWRCVGGMATHRPRPCAAAPSTQATPAAVYHISLTETLRRSPPHNRPASGRQWHYRAQQYKRLVEKGRRERCRQSCVSR
jgi:hypothetical protein